MARVERADGIGYNRSHFIKLNVRLDPSQVQDRRGQTYKPRGLGAMFQSRINTALQSIKPVSTEQFRARSFIMKPYRRYRIGAFRFRGH